MKRETKYVLLLIPIVLVLTAGLVYFSTRAPKSGRDRAPDFTVETLDGKQISSADLQGKPLFLNFWSSW